MAFVTDKTLFIHVQKTGGMSVREVLYQCRPIGRESGDPELERHYGMPELCASHPGIECGRVSFGFVRHPVNWLRSRWAFAVMTGFNVHTRHGRAAAATWMHCCWDEDFERFIEKYLERYPGIVTQTMFRMLGLWSPTPVNRVGTTETLFDDLIAILTDAGENLPSTIDFNRRKNATEESIVNGVSVSGRLAGKIMQAEQALCDRFNYFALPIAA